MLPPGLLGLPEVSRLTEGRGRGKGKMQAISRLAKED
jgi:hypothetical protein